MRSIKLLDCTLRDGGYVNDWEFGHKNIVGIYQRLIQSGVDVVEIGFLDDRRPFDFNRSIMPDTDSVRKIYGNIDGRPPMVVGMIDYGTCRLEHIAPQKEGYIDGIRVIFKKHIMHEAMAFCAELKKLGYIVFSQLVSITSYNDEELQELIRLVNEVKPYAVSMVDTYGLLDPKQLMHYYTLLDQGVDPEITIGFHAHNNFQLAYANAMTFVDHETDRNILVDGTLFGMGKSAGNAPLELLAMYLNTHHHKQYRIDPMLEAVNESISSFYLKSPWGYKIYFYLSAMNRCHPNYVKQFKSKPDLSISAVNDLLAQIEPEEKKLLYDKEAGEQLYNTYRQSANQDTEMFEKLSEALSGKKVLVLGPGRNIQLQSSNVSEFINREHPLVISINFVPGAYPVDYVFVTNAGRYLDMADDLLECKNRDVRIIATSNVISRNGKFAFSMSREPLLERNQKIEDNSFLMLLRVLKNSGIRELWCAGLDGYSEREDNYFNPKMEYAFIKVEAKHLNHHIKEALAQDYGDMKLHFLTYTHYLEVEDSHDAAF